MRKPPSTETYFFKKNSHNLYKATCKIKVYQGKQSSITLDRISISVAERNAFLVFQLFRLCRLLQVIISVSWLTQRHLKNYSFPEWTRQKFGIAVANTSPNESEWRGLDETIRAFITDLWYGQHRSEGLLESKWKEREHCWGTNWLGYSRGQ